MQWAREAKMERKGCQRQNHHQGNQPKLRVTALVLALQADLFLRQHASQNGHAWQVSWKEKH